MNEGRKREESKRRIEIHRENEIMEEDREGEFEEKEMVRRNDGRME